MNGINITTISSYILSLWMLRSWPKLLLGNRCAFIPYFHLFCRSLFGFSVHPLPLGCQGLFSARGLTMQLKMTSNSSSCCCCCCSVSLVLAFQTCLWISGFIKYTIFKCVCLCERVGVCVSVQSGQMSQIPRSWSYWWLWAIHYWCWNQIQVLLNYWDISPAPACPAQVCL